MRNQRLLLALSFPLLLAQGTFDSALPAEMTAPRFAVVMDVKPMRAEDDRSGAVRQGLALVPVYLSEADNVVTNAQGFCNLTATVLGGGPRIVTQQWNALQVYH